MHPPAAVYGNVAVRRFSRFETLLRIVARSTNIQPEALQQENRDMPRVKVHRAAQITLPPEVREKLGVSEGDYLDMELVENGVLLKPASEREEAWDRIFEAAKSVRYIGPEPRPSPEEEEQWIAEEIKAARRERSA